MATVLPQGRFDNITDKYIREFIISDLCDEVNDMESD